MAIAATEQSEKRSMQEVSELGTLPLLKHERQWGFWDFTWVNVGLAIATWGFLLGGATALFVGAERGIAAIIFGNLIGVVIASLAICMSAGRYGVEQYTLLRSVFGGNGVRVLVLGVLTVWTIGWGAILSLMFGRSTVNILNELGNTNFGDNSVVVTLLAIVAVGVSLLSLWRGPASVKWLNRIIGPALVVVSFLMLIFIFRDRGWSDIRAAEPLSPFGISYLDFMIAIEFNLAAGLGWWPVLGNLSRLTRTPRAAVWPNMIGCGAAAMLGEVIGLLAALTLGSSDPTKWMVPLGGAVFGVVACGFVAVANITSIVTMFYSLCLAVRQAGGKLTVNLRWSVLTAVSVLPVIVLTFFPSTVYDGFQIFIVWTAIAFAPLCGVTAADYLFLRSQRIDIDSLYGDRTNMYRFWRGFNFAPFIAIAVGAAVYMLLLHPVSLQYSAPFVFISASLPSCVSAGLAHFLLTRFFVMPANKGGY